MTFDNLAVVVGGYLLFHQHSCEVATEAIVGEPEAAEDPPVQQNTQALNEKVQVGNNQEMTKSDTNSHYENRGGKN